MERDGASRRIAAVILFDCERTIKKLVRESHIQTNNQPTDLFNIYCNIFRAAVLFEVWIYSILFIVG